MTDPGDLKGRVGGISLREAAELYHVQGLSSTEVGRIAGVDYRSVMRAFQRHNIPRRAPGQQAKVLAEHIREARRRGWTKVELARRLGLSSEATVIKAQRRLGIAWPERDRVDYFSRSRR